MVNMATRSWQDLHFFFLTDGMKYTNFDKNTEGLYATVGCHPCRANEFEAGAKSDSPAEVDRSAKEYLEALDQLIAEDQASGQSRVVAVGECGLGELCPSILETSLNRQEKSKQNLMDFCCSFLRVF
jgi:Tat protein secretion system quality control protein TatD with DNase activity